MRILHFRIEGQIIKPNGDFSGIVSGTKQYLYAQFHFSKEWNGAVKVAEFRRFLQDPISVAVKNNICEIPESVLSGKELYVRVIGKKKEMRIRTNECTVKQEA